MENIRRPTSEDYKKREDLAKDPSRQSEYAGFLNSIDWSPIFFEENGKHGVKNAMGELIVPAKYEDFAYLNMDEFEVGDPIVAKKNGNYGILEVGLEEKWFIEPQFDYIGHPQKYFSVKLDGKWGIYELETGEYKVPPVCDQVESHPGLVFVNGIGIYTIEGMIGLIDPDGKLTPAVYEEFDMDVDAPVKVKYKGEWGYVNEKCEFTLDEDEAYFFNSTPY